MTCKTKKSPNLSYKCYIIDTMGFVIARNYVKTSWFICCDGV